MTPSTGTLGGSAAYSPGPFRPLSPLVCVSTVHRTLRASSAPRVRPFATVRKRLLWPRLTSRSTGRAMSKRSARRHPFRRKARSPRVRRVTFAPCSRRIYVRPVRSAFGLQVSPLPRPPRGRLLCGSCSSGQSFAFSFLSASPHEATVAVQLGVPGTQGPQGILTPKSLPGSLSLTGCQRQFRRCRPCLAHSGKGRHPMGDGPPRHHMAAGHGLLPALAREVGDSPHYHDKDGEQNPEGSTEGPPGIDLRDADGQNGEPPEAEEIHHGQEA